MCIFLQYFLFESGPTEFWRRVSPVRYLAIAKSEHLFIARWHLSLILLWSCGGQSANHPRKAWWAPQLLSRYRKEWAALHSEIAVTIDLDLNRWSRFFYQPCKQWWAHIPHDSIMSESNISVDAFLPPITVLYISLLNCCLAIIKHLQLPIAR